MSSLPDRVVSLRGRTDLTRLFSSQTNDASTSAAERRLVDRLVTGDGDAWRLFVEQFGRIIRSRVADVARSFGCARDEATIDDVSAEVFAVLIANSGAALRGFEGRSSLSTYLAVIATRIATRGFASSRFRPSAGSEEPSAAQADPATVSPVRLLIEQEQKEKLLEVIERLPQKQKEIVQYYYLKDYSYSRISDLLSIPIGSVGVTLRRAEAKLRVWIEAEEN